MDKIAIKPNLHAITLPAIDRITDYTRPMLWLRQGWRDMQRTPLLSLGFGALFAVLGYTLVHFGWGGVQTGMTLTSGFLLIAPFLAVVFYDLSRQAEHHHAPRLTHILKPLRANGASIGFYALLLAFIFSVWERLSAIAVGLSVSGDPVSFAGFRVLLSGSGQPGILLPYAAVGVLLAVLVFALSVVSLPMMLHRKADLATALMTSLWVVRTNPLLMLEWALIIVALSVLGYATLFVAMVVVFPLIGHATWHVYRDLVER